MDESCDQMYSTFGLNMHQNLGVCDWKVLFNDGFYTTHPAKGIHCLGFTRGENEGSGEGLGGIFGPKCKTQSEARWRVEVSGCIQF